MSLTMFHWSYAWDLYAIIPAIAFIQDRREPGSRSLTHAADQVCADGIWVLGGRRIVYRDTEDGSWNEMLHDEDGTFLGFKPYDGTVPEEGYSDA